MSNLPPAPNEPDEPPPPDEADTKSTVTQPLMDKISWRDLNKNQQLITKTSSPVQVPAKAPINPLNVFVPSDVEIAKQLQRAPSYTPHLEIAESSTDDESCDWNVGIIDGVRPPPNKADASEGP